MQTASTRVLSELPKDVVALVAEQQRLLAQESTERQMVDILTNAKLFAADQKQAEWCVVLFVSSFGSVFVLLGFFVLVCSRGGVDLIDGCFVFVVSFQVCGKEIT
jgi:hypothetical protein